MNFMDYYLIGCMYAGILVFWVLMLYLLLYYIIPDYKAWRIKKK
jgi:hypothetical protein